MDTRNATLRFTAGGKNYRLGVPPLKASTLRAVVAARVDEGKATPLQVRQRTITKEGSFDNYVFTVLGSSADFTIEFPVDHSPEPIEAEVKAVLDFLSKNPRMHFAFDV
ncbi:hypothetical protein [Nesterenkonia sp. CF4.4]|uniref:hypothetical protein n=1 Tax=Nesterenkonia sp. CF4.4 TaxID=3373079 RepID=UPI003EE47621